MISHDPLLLHTSIFNFTLLLFILHLMLCIQQKGGHLLKGPSKSQPNSNFESQNKKWGHFMKGRDFWDTWEMMYNWTSNAAWRSSARWGLWPSASLNVLMLLLRRKQERLHLRGIPTKHLITHTMQRTQLKDNYFIYSTLFFIIPVLYFLSCYIDLIRSSFIDANISILWWISPIGINKVYLTWLLTC